MRHLRKDEILVTIVEVRDPGLWADIKSGRITSLSVGGQAFVRRSLWQRFTAWLNNQVQRLSQVWKRITWR